MEPVILAFSFLHPALLWGGALAAVPLIIHILNRRRFKIREWAAMEFLLRAFKQNRRRVRFEQLLLLLLRMSIPALLAFFLARPRASSEDVFGLTRKIIHHCVVLDDSGSMGEASGSGTAFDDAKRRVLQLAAQLGKRRGGDLFSLLRASVDRPLLAAVPVSVDLGARVAEVLRDLVPTPGRFHPGTTLEAAGKIDAQVRERAERLSLYLVSDLRRVDIAPAEDRLDESFLKGFRSLRKGGTGLYVLPAGESRGSNCAVTEVTMLDPRAIKGLPVRFRVTVRNQGRRAADGLELGFVIDGGPRLRRRLPPLAAGAERREVFSVTFDRTGAHYVEAVLPADRLRLDDRRALAFEVAEHANVLLVDGDPGEREELSEVFYLASALDPTEDGSGPVTVTRIDEFELGDRELSPFDVVVLANTGSVNEDTAQALEKYVEAGGGLLFTAGDQLDPAGWNRIFWRDGAGVSPMPLGGVDGDLDRPDPVFASARDHPLFSGLGDLVPKLLRLVRVGRWIAPRADAAGTAVLAPKASIVLRVRDENGAPLLVEAPFGSGRCALFLTSADAAWTSWPADFSYPILANRLVEFLMKRADLSPFNLGPRGVWIADLPAARYSGVARLSVAGDPARGGNERLLRGEPLTGHPDLLRLRAAPDDTAPWAMAGAYRVELERTEGGPETRFFTVNPWPLEGRLQRLDRRTFFRLCPKEVADRTRWIEGSGEAQAGFLAEEGEIWRFLAFAVLGFLLLETLLAWRFGRH